MGHSMRLLQLGVAAASVGLWGGCALRGQIKQAPSCPPPPPPAPLAVDALPLSVQRFRDDARRLRDAPPSADPEMVVRTMEGMAAALEALPHPPQAVAAAAGDVRGNVAELMRSKRGAETRAKAVRASLDAAVRALESMRLQGGRPAGYSLDITRARNAVAAVDPDGPLMRQHGRVQEAFTTTAEAVVAAAGGAPSQPVATSRARGQTGRAGAGAGPAPARAGGAGAAGGERQPVGGRAAGKEAAVGGGRAPAQAAAGTGTVGPPAQWAGHLRDDVQRLATSDWDDARSVAARTLVTLGQAIQQAAGNSPSVQTEVRNIQIEAARLQALRGRTLEEVERIRSALTSAVVVLESLPRARDPNLVGWTRAARTAVEAIDVHTPFELQRAVVQDAFRATVDALIVALRE